ncbi:MAG: sortase [Ruminococcus sp.]|nr:sortase [Ruminococcus sp.]
MSDTNKKNYTANDLLSEFFSDEETVGNTPAETAEASSAQTEAAVSEAETEEISAEEDDLGDDTEIVVDTLEEDTSEAENADIAVAGKSEWDSLEITETVSEIFDKSGISEDASPVSRGDSAVCEDSGNMEENVRNEMETEKETEISRNPKTETENISENDSPETEAFGGADDDIDSGFNESPAVRFFKGILPWKGDSVWEVIRKIIFIAASAVFVGAGCMLVSTLIQSKQAVEQKEKDKEVIVTTVATSIDESGNVITIAPTDEEVAEHRFNVAEYYKGINEDYIGYLELSGCDIAEPIVQGSDNDYYLTHAIHGGNNKAGTVFMDYRCTFSDDYISPNIVFYGHNQEDGTMFGNLKDYKQNVQFYEENPVVRFSTENETYEYLIYGFFVTNALANQDSNGFVFHYQDYIEALDDEYTFNWYREMVLERNQIISPVDVEYGDKLLCLSTCSNEFSNSRFVLFARMLREDEEIEDFDFSEAYLNPNAKGVDWEAIMSGETSATEEEVLDEDDEDDMDFGNGFLQTAVHGTRRPQQISETEAEKVTTVPLEENDGDDTKKTTKKTTETEETAEESDVLSEATRRSSRDTDTSESSESSTKKKKTEKTEKTEETEKEPDGETVTRSSKKTASKRTETETTAPAETAPPPPPDDGSSETVTAG